MKQYLDVINRMPKPPIPWRSLSFATKNFMPDLAGKIDLQTLPIRLKKNIRHYAGRMTYTSPLYNWSLGGTVPDKLLFSPTDLWAGDADSARWLIYNGAFSIGGDRLELHNADWLPHDVEDKWLVHINGFDWLRDLRALGGDEGRKSARLLIENWIKHFNRWDETAWRPDILGRRLGNWLCAYDFFGESADDRFQELFLNSVIRQLRHLCRTLPNGAHGLPLLYAIRGLVYGGLTIAGREAYLEQALDLLDEQIDKQILSDGGHISRNPQALLETIRILIDIRAAMSQAGYPGIEKIQHGLDRAVPALRFFRHGDGRFALFGDTQENNEELLKHTVMHAGSRARTLSSLPHSGYERVQMNRSLLIMDCGRTPSHPYNMQSHAGPLAFEFSHGKERIFVNCGAHPTCPQWQDALRSTPAHNTLAIDSRNISMGGKASFIQGRAKTLLIDREDKSDVAVIDACHDGYVPINGISHRRRVSLSDKGRLLAGEERLTCSLGLASAHEIAVRFHLHPKVMVSLVRGGADALLRLGNGAGWRFTAEGGTISVEDSVYLGEGIHPRKTKQIVIRQTMDADSLQINWNLHEESS
jgi:uncharacterized heparinase superfamily protein